uniref:Uncharacterized protein n=1 Tax=Chromera velia CCMP2878 TaxID=1169474 RepID=A0A0G4FZT3_9ALVE|eukprot:Cvel_3993.t1-p1 / transcript=Cvel_3993.t1 / gene=Cvel_3993 / organism=Chromera_velia_CCMP2878 / gene_product=hypothetical protein / transcript_product=hypothetical protein / location=Cvel_scaffold169:111913-113675(+) / protein_length=186 / sequence_SO=supercontig / SO=protein_coding / is_pseudo=false
MRVNELGGSLSDYKPRAYSNDMADLIGPRESDLFFLPFQKIGDKAPVGNELVALKIWGRDQAWYDNWKSRWNDSSKNQKKRHFKGVDARLHFEELKVESWPMTYDMLKHTHASLHVNGRKGEGGIGSRTSASCASLSASASLSAAGVQKRARESAEGLKVRPWNFQKGREGHTKAPRHEGAEKRAC